MEEGLQNASQQTLEDLLDLYNLLQMSKYRVFHKAVYTFLNKRGSVISGPIDLKPIPVNFTGHFTSSSVYIIL
jgi:hypothetical protein